MVIWGHCCSRAVPRWNADSTEFTVSVNISGNRGYQSTVPMPIVEMLGMPTHITFRVRGDEIVVTRGPEGIPVRSRRGRRRRAAKSGARRS